MGIGRFAFTPILPMMLGDGVVTLRQASWLASTNYLGYLVGALLCTFDPWLRRRLGMHRTVGATAWVHGGLVATALLTLAMASPWPAAWPTLRFAAGVVSAYVLLQSSGWCLAQLAVRGRPALGGVMFAGPGAGIVGSGLLGG
ncbi:MAG: MFS transporter, partial [Pseudomonadota bacterium]|nr:MFS transporter [Pseudomonadota bacterium]